MKKKRGFRFVNEGLIDGVLPKRQTTQSAAYDLHSIEDIEIMPGETKLVKTGITAFMQPDEWLHLKSRSGLSYKQGIIVGAGVIDADYFPNEIGVVVHNFSDKPFVVRKEDRIAQAIFSKFLVVDNDHAVGVRESGFGSTGK